MKMTFKKKVFLILLAAFYILINVVLITHHTGTGKNITLNMTFSSNQACTVQVYYNSAQGYSAAKSATQSYTTAGIEQTFTFTQPSDTQYLRIDTGDVPVIFSISRLWYTYNDETEDVDLSVFTKEKAESTHDVESITYENGVLIITSSGSDTFVSAKAGPTVIGSEISAHLQKTGLIKKILAIAIFNIICLLLFIFRKRFSDLPSELLHNRQLILQLAKNDFKTKYAGSVLGITWAFIQPTVTVLVYWFVFQVGLHSGDVVTPNGTYPFVLWLICGLVPWFFFQDTITGGTNSLLEYSYLVKKVVFKISILPIVKEISALFVHIFFIALMIVIFTMCGRFPDLYVLQVLYYSFSLFIYSLGVCYAFCAIVIFFRDLTQIITIIIQVQVWLTPIMWNIDTLGASFPGWLTLIFKLNPLYYIVSGYRDAMIYKVWFWDRFDLTIYFWIVTVVFFGLGTFIFKRLKVHFADIL